MAGKRPHVVFVRDIGPTFTFSSSTKAHERALELVTKPGGYCEVLVWDRGAFGERTVYRYDAPARVERFERGQWVALEGVK